MTISITSTTDSKEAVTAALGDLAPEKTTVEKPAEDVDLKTEGAEAIEPESLDEAATEDNEPGDKEENDDENPDTEAKPKKKGGFQKRIDKLNKRMSAVEQEREYWRQEALRVQQSKGPADKPEKVETKPDTSKRPKADDFASHDEYVEALTDYTLEQKLAAKEIKQKEDAVKTEAKTKREKHDERVSKFMASHDDWDDVVEAVGNVRTSITFDQAIVASEHGPEIMYELAKNPKELARICALSPIQAAMELGKVESRITKPSDSSDKKTTSKAPPPISPVRTRGASNVKSLYDESLSQHEFEKLRAEQLKLRG